MRVYWSANVTSRTSRFGTNSDSPGQLWLPVEQFFLVGVLLELVVSSTAYCFHAPKSGHRLLDHGSRVERGGG